MTDLQRVTFESNGFLVIPDALTPQELADVRHTADAAYARWQSDPKLLGARGETLHQVQTPIEYDEQLLNLLWHPATFPLVREILGDDVMMIDNDLFVTPAKTRQTHADWHYDVGMRGVHHPLSVMMVKVFFLLTDVNADSGGTAMIPGSHRFPEGFHFPSVTNPIDMPGSVQMTGKAGTAYLFNGRVYHCAVNNDSDVARKVLIYNYGHFWMKMWSGYVPSRRLLEAAEASGNPIQKQLLGIGDAYDQHLP